MQPQTECDLKVRLSTRAGDLVLRWKGKKLHVDGHLGTEKERKKLSKWLERHDEFRLTGDLKEDATIEAPSAIVLRGALMEFLEDEVGEPGYAVYAVDGILGKGKVLQHKSQVREAVEKDKAREVVKTPQVKGG